MLTNHPEKIIKTNVIASEISNHDMIVCQRKMNNINDIHKEKSAVK